VRFKEAQITFHCLRRRSISCSFVFSAIIPGTLRSYPSDTVGSILLRFIRQYGFIKAFTHYPAKAMANGVGAIRAADEIEVWSINHERHERTTSVTNARRMQLQYCVNDGGHQFPSNHSQQERT